MKEINYKITGNKAIVEIDSKIYPVVSIKKAMFNYLNDLYITCQTKRNKIRVLIESKKENLVLEDIIKDFLNDCLRESLRYEIANETKTIRELILGRALYSSCIKIDDTLINNKGNDKEEIVLEEDKDFSLEDIAINWFDKKKEDNEC